MYKDSAVRSVRVLKMIEGSIKSRRQVFRKMDYKSVKISEDAKLQGSQWLLEM